jgi:fumarylpyruvate hydrolase
MTKITRRTMLAASGTTAAVLATGGAEAQTAVKTPFAVAQTTIPVVGTTDVFPVRRIYCIGRNYAAHAR